MGTLSPLLARRDTVAQRGPRQRPDIARDREAFILLELPDFSKRVTVEGATLGDGIAEPAQKELRIADVSRLS